MLNGDVERYFMPKKTVTLYLIRHGLTKQNLARQYQGTKFNYDIHDKSRDLILERRERGDVPEIKTLWVSPLVRAKSTATLYFPGMMQHIDPDLQERDFGCWDGHTHEELLARPDYLEFLDKNCATTEIEGGESWNSFQERLERVLLAIEELAKNAPDQFPLALVFHGGPIFYLTYRLLPEEHPFSLYSCKGASGLKMELMTDPLRAVEASELFTDKLDIELTPFYRNYES